MFVTNLYVRWGLDEYAEWTEEVTMDDFFDWIFPRDSVCPPEGDEDDDERAEHGCDRIQKIAEPSCLASRSDGRMTSPPGCRTTIAN